MNTTPVRPGIAERLSRMIQLPTVSAELEERGSAPFEAFVELLAELYPRTHEALVLERHTDLGLLLRWQGATTADPIVLMAHYDVVPVDESDPWTYPPFEGRIADGWVFGRGALDDKGPFVVIMDAVENLLEAGFTPARDVYLSFGGDEECDGPAAKEIARVLHERGIRPWLILDEGGAVVDAPLPFVRGRSAMIGVAEKGIVDLSLSVREQPGHASMPPEYTAVRRIARAVDRLGPTTFRPHASKGITAMFARFAEQTNGPARQVLRLLSAWPWLTGRALALAGKEPAALVRTTIAATMQSGGTAANVLPSQASATLNLRIGVTESVRSVTDRVRRRVGDPNVAVTVIKGSDPSPESHTDNAQFALIGEAVAAAYPGVAAVPYIMMAASDARHFHRYFPEVYRFAPLEMSAAQRASIHGIDERVEIASLERGEIFHRTLIEGLGGAR